jgi:hypothetical protein
MGKEKKKKTKKGVETQQRMMLVLVSDSLPAV